MNRTLVQRKYSETVLKEVVQSCDAIIVNFNAGRWLHSAVRSALDAGVARVIVVDNASHDDSLLVLDQIPEQDRISIILNVRNLGFASACNVGIRHSVARTLLFLNPDSEMHPDALAALHDVLIADEVVGMVGGMLLNPDGTEQAGGRRAIPTPWRSFVRAFGLSRFSNRWPRLFSDYCLHEEPVPKSPTQVEALSGACMLLRREALVDVGLWDEGYFLHCEDLDLAMTLRQHGWQIMFAPEALITHQKGACSQANPIFVEWHKHRGMIRFYRKFFMHQYPGVLMWLVVGGVWLRFSLVSGYHVIALAKRWISRK